MSEELASAFKDRKPDRSIVNDLYKRTYEESAVLTLERDRQKSDLEDIGDRHEHHLEAMKQEMEILKKNHTLQFDEGFAISLEHRREASQLEEKEIGYAKGFKMGEEKGIKVGKEMGEGSEVIKAANLVEAKWAGAIRWVLKTIER
ncbi:B-block binding subunit of TFIIIC, partial [Striga asiatica]